MSVKSSVLLSVFAAIAVVCIAAFVMPVAPKNPASQGELGPVALCDLADVVGGAEGSGCYIESNPDCGGVNDKGVSYNLDHSCPPFAQSCGFKRVYYAVQRTRAKRFFESTNTNTYNEIPNQKCYEQKACVGTRISDSNYNGVTCVTSAGYICYACSNPDMSGSTVNVVTDYHCDDP